MIPIFVYGTLRLGEGNSHFLRNSVLDNKLHKLSGHDMHEVCSSFPGIVEGSGDVYGELAYVDESTLQMLDMLEGVPDFYDRKEVYLDGYIRAYAYVLPIEYSIRPKIHGGDWVKHRKRR